MASSLTLLLSGIESDIDIENDIQSISFHLSPFSLFKSAVHCHSGSDKVNILFCLILDSKISLKQVLPADTGIKQTYKVLNSGVSNKFKVF